MNIKNKNLKFHCEPIALSGAAGAVEAGRSKLPFNGKIQSKNFYRLPGDCSPALACGASVVATNAPRNDIKWEGAA